MMEFAEFNEKELEYVKIIVDRIGELRKNIGVEHDALNLRMDIACVHHFLPLDLKALSEAAAGYLVHDVGGINRNLNRETGELENHFYPQYTL